MSKSRGNVQDPDELVRALRRRHRPPVPDVHGPVGPGRPVEPDRHRRRPRFLNRVWTLALDPHGRERGRSRRRRPAGGRGRGRRARRALRAAAHRTLRDVTEDYEGFRLNTMVAKLMELSNLLFRYRGTSVAGAPEWDEAVAAAAADAGAGRAAHHRGALVRGWPRPAARPGSRSTSQALAGASTRRPSSRRRARSRSRSTASCATRSPSRPASATSSWSRSILVARQDRRPRSAAAIPTGSSTPAAASWSTSSSARRALGRALTSGRRNLA